jgi:hypothetical protein
MAQLLITPRRVAPYVISGATGVHVILRMRNLSRQPATDAPFYSFLLKNTDVILALGGASVVIWQLAQHKPRQQTPGSMTAVGSNDFAGSISEKSLIARVVHELRQVFTALLLGLGLIERKADTGNTQAISDLVRRLKAVVRSGIDTVNALQPSGAANGQEREYRS